ncbi:nickel transporter permease [Thermaerobacter litoralis]
MAALRQDLQPTAPMPAAPALPVGRGFWRRFFAHRSAVLGGGIVLAFVLVALLAPLLAPYHPTDDANLIERLQPPSAEHWLGTDHQGRDILSRIMYGARISLRVGVVSMLMAALMGTVWGALAGYYGGWFDMLSGRLVDLMLAFPSILLAIAFAAFLGPSLENTMYAVALVAVPQYMRLVRGQVLSLREQDYVAAARALGFSDARIIVRHILPNALAPLIVQATLGVGTAVLDAAALSFLGLGAVPPQPEWGRMLNDARTVFRVAPWNMTFPGLAIMLVVLGFNLLGDGLRDILDPRSRDD